MNVIKEVSTFIHKGNQGVRIKVEGCDSTIFLPLKKVRDEFGIDISEVEILLGSTLIPEFFRAGEALYNGKICDTDNLILKNAKFIPIGSIEEMREKNSDKIIPFKKIVRTQSHLYFLQSENNEPPVDYDGYQYEAMAARLPLDEMEETQGESQVKEEGLSPKEPKRDYYKHFTKLFTSEGEMIYVRTKTLYKITGLEKKIKIAYEFDGEPMSDELEYEFLQLMLLGSYIFPIYYSVGEILFDGKVVQKEKTLLKRIILRFWGIYDEMHSKIIERIKIRLEKARDYYENNQYDNEPVEERSEMCELCADVGSCLNPGSPGCPF